MVDAKLQKKTIQLNEFIMKKTILFFSLLFINLVFFSKCFSLECEFIYNSETEERYLIIAGEKWIVKEMYRYSENKKENSHLVYSIGFPDCQCGYEIFKNGDEFEKKYYILFLDHKYYCENFIHADNCGCENYSYKFYPYAFHDD